MSKIISRSVRASEDTFKEFVELADSEGRIQGKFLQILIDTFKKAKEEVDNEGL